MIKENIKIIGVIPARYASSRLPGKPLADICGKPMIWWVYNQVKKVEGFESVIVATDDDRIEEYCNSESIAVVRTSDDCPNHIHRIFEVSDMIEADYYVSINGDEPLIDAENIKAVFPKEIIADKPVFFSVYREMEDPAEVLDLSNVKIVLDQGGRCLYQSRFPIPNPKASIGFKYKKAIGIECFNKLALNFFAHSDMGILEKIEDIDHLRFLENGVPILYRKINSESLSVDTKADLEKVVEIIEKRLRETSYEKSSIN